MYSVGQRSGKRPVTVGTTRSGPGPEGTTTSTRFQKRLNIFRNSLKTFKSYRTRGAPKVQYGDGATLVAVGIRGVIEAVVDKVVPELATAVLADADVAFPAHRRTHPLHYTGRFNRR